MKSLLLAVSVVLVFSSCTKEPTTGPQTSIGNAPPDFFLKQNFPNPFIDTTAIEFGVPISSGASSAVYIVVYDPLLEPIRTLVSNSSHPAGVFKTKWDGKNYRGINVSSGLYIIEMKGYIPQSTIIRITAIKK